MCRNLRQYVTSIPQIEAGVRSPGQLCSVSPKLFERIYLVDVLETCNILVLVDFKGWASFDSSSVPKETKELYTRGFGQMSSMYTRSVVQSRHFQR